MRFFDRSSLSCPRPARARLRAFTLIELLVVVSIIALLVSILLPALGRARDQARSGVCKVNLRSMGQAEQFYAESHNGKAAWIRYDDPERGGQCFYWAAQLWSEFWSLPIPMPTDLDAPAIERPSWLTCPSAKIITDDDGFPISVWGDVHRWNVPYTDPRYFWLHHICYARNVLAPNVGVYQPSAGYDLPQVTLDRIDRPAEMVDITDGSSINFVGNPTLQHELYIDGQYNPANYEGGDRRTAYRHMGGEGLNVLLWDGHVEEARRSILAEGFHFTPDAYAIPGWKSY